MKPKHQIFTLCYSWRSYYYYNYDYDC